jgi:sugar phosphate isomerase/epimerase
VNDNPLDLSVLVTSLPFPAEISLAELARQGFRHVDLVGKAQRPDVEREALADSGLVVDCVALGRDLPDGCSLDAREVAPRRMAVEEVQRQLAEAAQVGARVAYVVPTKDAALLPAFADACQVLAAYAQNRMIRLCVEHFPGSALPTAAQALAWLNTDGLQNVGLVLDLGHCLMSREDPLEVASKAGNRLGYVQLDDNDSVNDVHWPLLTGVLTEAMLKAFLHRLRQTDYRAGIALELNGKLGDPLRNLLDSKKIVEAIWRESPRIRRVHPGA